MAAFGVQLAACSGVCKLIHVTDFRVVPLPQEAIDMITAGNQSGGFAAFLNIAQFAEVGQGTMNWPAILPAAEAAGAEYFFIEQDETYGRDPFDCLADSRAYLKSIGYWVAGSRRMVSETGRRSASDVGRLAPPERAGRTNRTQIGGIPGAC